MAALVGAAAIVVVDSSNPDRVASGVSTRAIYLYKYPWSKSYYVTAYVIAGTVLSILQEYWRAKSTN